MKVCKSCGARLKLNMIYCPKCGVPVRPEQKVDMDVQKKSFFRTLIRSWKFWAVAAIFLLLIIRLFGGVRYYLSGDVTLSSVSKQLNEMPDNIYAEVVDEAYAGYLEQVGAGDRLAAADNVVTEEAGDSADTENTTEGAQGSESGDGADEGSASRGNAEGPDGDNSPAGASGSEDEAVSADGASDADSGENASGEAAGSERNEDASEETSGSAGNARSSGEASGQAEEAASSQDGGSRPQTASSGEGNSASRERSGDSSSEDSSGGDENIWAGRGQTEENSGTAGEESGTAGQDDRAGTRSEGSTSPAGNSVNPGSVQTAGSTSAGSVQAAGSTSAGSVQGSVGGGTQTVSAVQPVSEAAVQADDAQARETLLSSYESYLDKNLSYVFDGNYSLTRIGSEYYATAWVDGAAAEIEAIMAGKITMTEWGVFRDSLTGRVSGMYEQASSRGLSDVHVNLDFLNDKDLNRVLISFRDGAVVYDLLE